MPIPRSHHTALPARPWQPTRLVRASIAVHVAGLAVVAGLPEVWPWLGGALVGNHALLALGLNPRSQLTGSTLTHLGPGPEVALTFDDGPDPEVTPRVLDLLDGAGARGTFFCIGARAARHPGLIEDIARRGHRVENHTWSHPSLFAAYGPRAIADQVRRGQAILAELTGVAPGWLRAPLGMRSPLLDPVLAATGLMHASWTRRAFDTRCADPARVARRLVRQLAGGDILLLHDGSSALSPQGRPVVLEALPAVLDAIHANGLRAVTLPQPRPVTDRSASPEPVIARQAS